MDEEIEAIADYLIEQQDEPWPSGSEADRLHYWREGNQRCEQALRPSPAQRNGSVSDSRRIMTDKERAEIEEIERRCKARFEAKLKKLGPAFLARHPRLS